MTALGIINQARERLGDEKKQRWSDNRLLTIISQGQVDICVESGYLRREARLPLTLKQTRFKLPSDCVSIKRVEYQGKLLPLHTRSDQDVPRALTTDFTAYKSNLNMQRLEVQPPLDAYSVDIQYFQGGKIEDALYVGNPYGVTVSTNSSDLVVAPLFGVITGISTVEELSLPSRGFGELASGLGNEASILFNNGEFGVVTEAEYTFSLQKYGFISKVDNHLVSGKYGLVGNVASAKDTIHVYYTASPAKITFKGTILQLPDIWEDILMRYVVGTALQDDNDANNIQRGEAELQKYMLKLQTIKDLSSKDFSSSTSDKYVTNYRRI